jgi:hypothetical protein
MLNVELANRFPHSQAPLGNAYAGSSASKRMMLPTIISPLKSLKQSFKQFLPKQSLGRRETLTKKIPMIRNRHRFI